MNEKGLKEFDIIVILQVIFIVFKLCGVIDWSWWMVFIPLWGFVGIIFSIFIILFDALFVAFFINLIRSLFKRKN